MSYLNALTLVLNKGTTPINIKSVAQSICDLFSEVTEFVEHESHLMDGSQNPYYYSYHDWSSWSSLKITKDDNQDYLVDLAPDGSPPAIVKAKRVIHCGHDRIVRAPFVMIHKEYDQIPDLDIRFTKKNIWLRDNCKCQYCRKGLSLDAMTYDHVIPRSAGGKHTWTNVVSSCFACNTQKGSKTLKQAKMKLIGWNVPNEKGVPTVTYEPFKPDWYPLFSKFSNLYLPEWDSFLPEAAKKQHPALPNHSNWLKHNK